MRSSFQLLAVMAVVAGLTLASCGGEESPTGNDATGDENVATKPKPQGSSLLKVGDKLFNLPSPLETAMLIEEVGGDFYEDMLNPNTDATQYSVKTIQAMNLGVYGADLGYCLIYNQSQKAFRLLATTKNSEPNSAFHLRFMETSSSVLKETWKTKTHCSFSCQS